MSIALRLEPSLPVETPDGPGRALIMLDYSEDHNLFWITALDASGEIWCYPSKWIRVQRNRTLGTECDPNLLLKFAKGVDHA